MVVKSSGLDYVTDEVGTGEELTSKKPQKSRVRKTSPEPSYSRSPDRCGKAGGAPTARHLPSNPGRSRSPKRSADKSQSPREQKLSAKRNEKSNKKTRSVSPKSRFSAIKEKTNHAEEKEALYPRSLSPTRATEAAKDSAPRTPIRGQSPETSLHNRTPKDDNNHDAKTRFVKRQPSSPKRSPTSRQKSQQSTSNRSLSPKKTRPKSPKRAETEQQGSSSVAKHNRSPQKSVSAPPKKLREPSITLTDVANMEGKHKQKHYIAQSASETDTDEESTGNPRYVSAKGHTTHLQLQLDPSKVKTEELPVFSLLDESSNLLHGIEGSPLNEPSQQFEPQADKDEELAAKTTTAATASTTPTSQQYVPQKEEHFQPWGSHLDCMATKLPRSPLAVQKVMKALKYAAKPSLVTGVGKLSTGFQHTLGLNHRHQAMDDHDDDLAQLISA